MPYSIRDLTRNSGETKRTIRYYVQLGLLPPPERLQRAASYSDEHLTLLRRIRQLQGEGYTLQQVKERLDLSFTPKRRAKRAGTTETPGAEASFLAPKMARPATWMVEGGRASRFEIWRRVSVTPEIELHVKGRSARTAARLERVLRRALGEETRELKEERTE